MNRRTKQRRRTRAFTRAVVEVRAASRPTDSGATDQRPPQPVAPATNTS